MIALTIKCLDCENQFETDTTEGIVCPECGNEYYSMSGRIGDDITIEDCTVDNRQLIRV